MVLFATYLYSYQELNKSRPPPIRIHSYEKTTIDRDPADGAGRDLSIKLPLTPLKLETGLSSSRPASPNQQHKRKGESATYFTKHFD